MLDPEVLVTDVISDTAMEIISEGLSQFNDEHTGYSDRKPLAVLVRDPGSGKIRNRKDVAWLAFSRSVFPS
jgi:hypothetical protein